MPTVEDRTLTWNRVAAIGIVTGVIVNGAYYGYSTYLTLKGRGGDPDIARQVRDLQRQLNGLSQQAKDDALNELEAGGASIEHL